ncbi:unnamed protein product [Diatraea saccharalis]|uniref:Peptidase metallopeptidase domain-containing protein n=1 Tax=Diatraea saccharalis TaxID=40085 RepID=A0A9N9W6Y1_9NEOP|nr:unnamed protein product [Diatraea saccharalis]
MNFNKGMSDKLAIQLLKNSVSVSGLDQTEPGFDLTDEEIHKFKLWPNGIVPYYIDDFSYDKVLRDRIRNFLGGVDGITGLHFRELPTPPSDDNSRWVFFVNRQAKLGCSDHTPLNFTNDGVQKVVFGYNCMAEEGELSEAVLAIVGVPPQHNSPDRDSYVTVEMDHILPGENDGFSYTDILKIRMLYNYISRKKSRSINGPECDKLFTQGKNFNSFKPDSEEVVKPRRKPNRYLGLPDNADKETKDENGDVEDEKETKDGNGIAEDEKLNSNEEAKSKEEETTPENERDDVKEERTRSLEIHTLKSDPLLTLSDYDTAHEHDRLMGSKKRGRLMRKK